ncbi:MAG: Gfo/Idh/MocA family oxidoreductase [bacterium]|nr:Gfo/Idh/MocA family oxidoreductase [bacterium]MDD5353805.1 Gfo/Idh/MocA family oxidoreductase [bacterium]MDD5756177.1 Gfo/Idh/MocA family oxidoreductase [bacterium]
MTATQEKIIGHIGLGYWGKNILRNLYESGVLHTACDSDSRIVEEKKSQFPKASYTISYREVLSNPEIKAVTIAAPAVTHFQIAREALLAGKDVFVEKPLALTAREGQELVDIASRENKILMVGHILQYHPAVIKLKEIISAGKLGKVQYLYSNRLNIGKLRTEENILWSFAPHDISVILMLLGEEPVKVRAMGGAYLNQGVFDTTMTTLEFTNGVKGHIFVSWLHPYKEQKLIVVGDAGMAVFDDLTKEKLFLYPHKIEWKEGKIPVAQKADYQVIPVDSAEPLKLELEQFLDSVRQRKQPVTDGAEGVRVLRVLEAAEKDLAGAGSGRQNNMTEVFIHESAYVDEGAEIGKGTKIWHFSHILKGTKIGERCVIGQNVAIGPDVTVGNNCKIQNNVSVYKAVTLEDNVFCGPSCVFTNVYNPRSFIERKNEFRQTLVKKGASIGANATVVCGATIGCYAFVGAGAVVKKDVADYAIVAGVPARQVGWTCKCGTTLKPGPGSATCGKCGSEYKIDNNSLSVVKENV